MKLKMIILFLAVFGWSPALYGQGFPNKPIELVVSSSPGGGIDLIFRLLAGRVSEHPFRTGDDPRLQILIGRVRRFPGTLAT